MGWLLLILAIYVLAIWIKRTESGQTFAGAVACFSVGTSGQAGSADQHGIALHSECGKCGECSRKLAAANGSKRCLAGSRVPPVWPR